MNLIGKLWPKLTKATNDLENNEKFVERNYFSSKCFLLPFFSSSDSVPTVNKYIS